MSHTPEPFSPSSFDGVIPPYNLSVPDTITFPSGFLRETTQTHLRVTANNAIGSRAKILISGSKESYCLHYRVTKSCATFGVAVARDMVKTCHA